jgi:hypothetical protein
MEDTWIIDVDGRDVMCSKCEEGFTLHLMMPGGGGPIICDEDFGVALEKFKDALNICLAVTALMTVNRMMSEGATDEEIKNEIEKKLKK